MLLDLFNFSNNKIKLSKVIITNCHLLRPLSTAPNIGTKSD